MSFDLHAFGNKVRRSREQVGLSVTEVASKTGIGQERLQGLENGKIEPTGDEVLILADFFKQNYVYYISNQKESSADQVDILYRKFGTSFSKEDRWAIQEFIFLCECEQQVFEIIGFEKVGFNFVPKGDFFKAHGEEAARALRIALNLKDDKMVPNPYSVFRRLGIHIFRRKLNNSKISGLFINHPWAGKCVLVNYNEDIFRQNFTLAHEIAHTIFDASEQINISFEWNNKDLKEIRANSFASHFLVPKSILAKTDKFYWNSDRLIHLAQQLGVNTDPLLIAIKNAGINVNTELFSNVKVPLTKKFDPELLGLTDFRYNLKLSLLERGLSEFYVTNLHRAYEKGEISAGRLADCLLCDESNLQSIVEIFKLKLLYDN